MLRHPRKFEDTPAIDKVFGQNLKRPLKISAKGKADQVILRFREVFTVEGFHSVILEVETCA